MNRSIIAASLTIIGLAFCLGAGFHAAAAELRQVGTIAVPGNPLKTYDIGVVDQRAARYYLADRSNASLDIFDLRTGTFVGRVGGFVGQKESNANSGPNGVAVDGGEAWVSDGDSTVKFVDLASGHITDTVSTGGSARADELAYDPTDRILIAVNNADDPPFVTLISTAAGHKIIGKIAFKYATDGAEEPEYIASTGRITVSIPRIGPDKTTGAVAVIDPRTASLERMVTVKDCAPAGQVRGPGSQLLLGCQAGDKDLGIPPQTVVLDVKTYREVKRIKGIGGADMVAYDPSDETYVTGASKMPDGPAVGVIDARHGSLLQVIALPAGSNPHSIAVDTARHHVLVPMSANAKEGGVIAVFGSR